MDNTNNNEDKVNESVKPGNPSATPPAASETAVSQTPAQPLVPLKPVGEFFRNVWQVYRDKYWQLVGLVLLPVALLTLPVFLNSVAGAILGIVGILSAIFAQGAVIVAVLRRDTAIAWREAYRETWFKFSSILWVAVLVSFITIGGFLLFVIPGVIFTVWFMFSLVALLVENNRGMEALLKSREYVRNYFWPVFGRYLLFVLISLVVVGVISGLVELFVGDVVIVAAFAEALLALVLIPFGVVFQVLLYENLKSVKVGQTMIVNGGRKTAYLVWALVGWLWIIVMLWMMSVLFAGFAGWVVGGGLKNLDLPITATDTPISLPPSELLLDSQIQLQGN